MGTLRPPPHHLDNTTNDCFRKRFPFRRAFRMHCYGWASSSIWKCVPGKQRPLRVMVIWGAAATWRSTDLRAKPTKKTTHSSQIAGWRTSRPTAERRFSARGLLSGR